jgi:hypothetical protein
MHLPKDDNPLSRGEPSKNPAEEEVRHIRTSLPAFQLIRISRS